MKTTWHLVKQTLVAFLNEDALRLAAALAFYAVLSLAPIIILLLSVAGQIWGDEPVRTKLAEQIGQVVGPESARALNMVIQAAGRPEGRGAAALLGLATLLFAATGLFAQLQGAMNHIWNVKAEPGRRVWKFLRKRAIGVIMLVLVALLMLASLLLTTGINRAMTWYPGWLPGSDLLWRGLNLLASLLVFTVLFGLMFQMLPDIQIRWRDVGVGAAVTAILFAAGKELIGLYLGRSRVGSPYGAAGSLVVLLLWIYGSALIVLLGAEFTQVYASWRGRRIQPEEHAVPEDETAMTDSHVS